MRKEKVTKRLKQNKGITLIALIITIIVLLILAGVTIAAITSNESAPNKAVEARNKNEQGAEFDAIKLAATSSVAEGNLDLYVDVPTLRNGLTGLIQEDPAEVITTNATEWTVTGNSGVKYLITNRGMVTLASTVDIEKAGQTVTGTTINLTEADIGTTIQLTAKPTADLTINSATWESSNTSMATIDNNGLVTINAIGKTTITLTAQTTGGNFTKTCIINIEKPLEIGDTVTYLTTLNNTALTMDWKVFHKETIGNTEYTWIILSDYLPNSYVNIINIEKNNSYGVCTYNNITDLINAMTTTSNWSSLLSGTLNGTAIDYTSTTDTNIKAIGSPTLELWQASWNAKYPNKAQTYTTNQLYITSDSTGYLVSRTNNPPTSSETSVSMSGSEGYKDSSSGNYDTLYFPHSFQWNSTSGYWLASRSAIDTNYVMYVYYNGQVTGRRCSNSNYAFRPVVCLPSSVFE